MQPPGDGGWGGGDPAWMIGVMDGRDGGGGGGAPVFHGLAAEAATMGTGDGGGGSRAPTTRTSAIYSGDPLCFNE